jgi:hypothetical protein
MPSCQQRQACPRLFDLTRRKVNLAGFIDIFRLPQPVTTPNTPFLPANYIILVKLLAIY